MKYRKFATENGKFLNAAETDHTDISMLLIVETF